MIYDRWGTPVTLLRYATADDVQRLENRKPDKTDRAAIEGHCYIVCQNQDHNRDEFVSHQAYLRADGAAAEIGAVIDAWPRPFTAADFKRVGRGVELEGCPSACGDWRPAVIVSRTATTLRVDVQFDNVAQSYSFSAADAKRFLRWPPPKTETK